jgi:hypothetical protein
LYSNNDDHNDVSRLAAKRYQRYLKEEEKRKRYPQWIQNIITAILMLVKLITNALEKASIKKKRVIEKISIE